MNEDKLEQCIQENKTRQAPTLDLSDLMLTGREKEWEQLGSCTHLKTLTLNGLQVLPKNLPLSLEELNVAGNKNVKGHIENLRPLRDLKQLKKLNLSHNQIDYIAPLQRLPQLEEVDLSANNIKSFPAQLLTDLPLLTNLCLQHNPIENLPLGIVAQTNCAQLVRDYFADLLRGSVERYDTRVVLFGNQGIGKTSLMERWLGGVIAPSIPNAPLFLGQTVLNDVTGAQVQLEVCNFANVDTWQALYPLLAPVQTIFVLMWDAQTEQSNTKKSVADWLREIYAVGKASPVLLMQSHAARDGVQTPANWEQLTQQYPNIAQKIEINTNAADNSDLASFEHCLRRIIQPQMLYTCTTLPMAWWQVREKLAQQAQSGQHLISLETFLQICEQHTISNSASVQNYWESTGFCYVCAHSIIIDQVWAMSLVHQLQGCSTASSGWLTGASFGECWGSLGSTEALVGWMVARGVCGTKDDVNTPFAQRSYLIPTLLPSKETVSPSSTNQGLYIIFYHPFLHTHLLHQLMLELLPQLEHKFLQKDQLVFNHEGQKIILRSLPNQQAFVAHLQPIDSSQNQPRKAWRYLKQILVNQGLTQVGEWLSTDGEGYISRETLENHSPDVATVEALNGQTYDFKKFEGILSPVAVMQSILTMGQKSASGLPDFFVQKLNELIEGQYDIVLRYRTLKNDAKAPNEREKHEEEIQLRLQNIQEMRELLQNEEEKALPAFASQLQKVQQQMQDIK